MSSLRLQILIFKLANSINSLVHYAKGTPLLML